MLVKLIPEVDFSKLCAPSQKLPAHSTWKKFAIQFHQQYLSQISKLTFATSVRHCPNTILPQMQ
jgi:hypothetical protein